MDFKWWIYL